MSHAVYESKPHLEGPETELVHSVGDYFPLTIGELPGWDKIAEISQGFSDAIDAAKAGEATEDETLVPDRLIDFEIFPIGEAETHERLGLGDSHEDRETKRRLHFLFQLRDEWGNDSEVAGWKFRSQDDKARPAHKKREFDYMAVLLKDKNGEVSALVAETLEQNNAMYVWRADASPALSWEEVAASRKHEARNDLYARQFLHKGDITGRVMHYLTMPAEQYIAIREREFKNADRIRQRQRTLAEAALRS